MEDKEVQECIKFLKASVMFRYCSEDNLRLVAKSMQKKHYKKGDTLIEQGEPTTQIFLISEGHVKRMKTVQGTSHQIDEGEKGTTFGSFHIIRQDPSFASAKCTTDVTAFIISAKQLNSLLVSKPSLANDMIHSLSKEIRHIKNQMRTPLLEQPSVPIPIIPTTIAAAMESFYRSALNSFLNARLSGQRGALFPNMHIQMPTRVVYINGIKNLRHYLNNAIKPDDYSNPTAVRLGLAVAPGVLMTPMSSILEASNAGHLNPEPIYTRWIRGLVPRTAREIIFALGLNQLSDWCEERVPRQISESKALRNAMGSLTAGVISGYISHVPHNLSTLKLLTPAKSYWELFQGLVSTSESRLPTTMPPTLRRGLGFAGTFLFPKGVHIRTTQIVGSFIILNGTISALQDWNVKQYLAK